MQNTNLIINLTYQFKTKLAFLCKAILLCVFVPHSPYVLGNSDISSILEHSKNLSYERELLSKHEQLSRQYHAQYEENKSLKQPANKTEKCLINSDAFNDFVSFNTLLFWEGSCLNGKAEGFGRMYVITNGRKVFEMLTNFHSDEPQYTTTYYSKNTLVPARTIFFYGKSNSFSSSGITITKSSIDNDLIVSMQNIDKKNLITYSKETSKKVEYVLNIKDLGNYSHLIHDLSNTSYRSLFMSYKLIENGNSNNTGYSFIGQKSGALNGSFTDVNGIKENKEIPLDVIQHIVEINEEIEINIENSIKNVIEALPVVDAYLNVICKEEYQNPVCTKMKCKQMCDIKETITPDYTEVKELLLRLVEHHNQRPLKTYLEHVAAISNQDNQFNDNNIEDIENLNESINQHEKELEELNRASNIDGLETLDDFEFLDQENKDSIKTNPEDNLPLLEDEVTENIDENIDSHQLRRSLRKENLNREEILQSAFPKKVDPTLEETIN